LEAFVDKIVNRLKPTVDLSFWLAIIASVVFALGTAPFEHAIICFVLGLCAIWWLRSEAKREGRRGMRQ
jgi:apolipoprotein N-acyltransferase